MKPNPCYNCSTRHEACHSTCEGYIQWKLVRDAAKEAMRRDYNYEEYMASTTEKKVKRTKYFRNRGGSIR